MGLFRKEKEKQQEHEDNQKHHAAGPPPGPPPPQYQNPSDIDFAPPPGPPPGFDEPQVPQFQPPSYAPPETSHFDSLYSNADDDERDLGDHFCAQHPLFSPTPLSEAESQKAASGRITLQFPPTLGLPTKNRLAPAKRFKGEIQTRDGAVYIRSKKDTKDCVLVSDVPLYSPMTFRNAMIYYEMTITSLPHPEEAAIAIGYTCLPYPPFRMVGWHRGSLAVHSDDGRKYVNDSLSGKDFTRPFSQGEVVGLGIDYVRGSVFFTRNGAKEGEWLLASGAGVDPYRQYRDGSVEGLNGDNNVFAAVGVFGSVGASVNFKAPFKYAL